MNKKTNFSKKNYYIYKKNLFRISNFILEQQKLLTKVTRGYGYISHLIFQIFKKNKTYNLN